MNVEAAEPKPEHPRAVIGKASRKKRRGRPRKVKGDHSSERRNRAHWSEDGQVFFTGSYGWGLYLVEIPSTDGRKSYDVKNICLGKEEQVLAILGGGPMPDTLTPVQREVLTKIVGNGGKNVRSNKHEDRTQRFSFGKRTSGSFRSHYRYGARVER